jgi:hypothetical protein
MSEAALELKLARLTVTRAINRGDLQPDYQTRSGIVLFTLERLRDYKAARRG